MAIVYAGADGTPSISRARFSMPAELPYGRSISRGGAYSARRSVTSPNVKKTSVGPAGPR